jgi:hypothetical protein
MSVITYFQQQIISNSNFEHISVIKHFPIVQLQSRVRKSDTSSSQKTELYVL